MTQLNWPEIFSWVDPELGASEFQIDRLLDDLSGSLTEAELRRMEAYLQQNPYPSSDPRHHSFVPIDPRTLAMPAPAHLPASYRDFLEWSDGGRFGNGDREIELLAGKR